MGRRRRRSCAPYGRGEKVRRGRSAASRGYFVASLKRTAKLFPAAAVCFLVLFGTVLFIGVGLADTHAKGDDMMKTRVGIVGDMSDSYLSLGVSALKNMDSSRFGVDFETFSTEADAKNALIFGEIVGYIRVPENFVHLVLDGEDCSVSYVTQSIQNTFDSAVMREIAEEASLMIKESQGGIYAFQDLARALEYDNAYELGDTLALRYVGLILSRADMYEVTELGAGDGISIVGYFFCGIITLLIMLFGISCERILRRKDSSFCRFMTSRGASPVSLVFCEFFAVFVFSALLVMALSALFSLFAGRLSYVGFSDASPARCIFFGVGLLPVLAAFLAASLAVYEIVPSGVGAVILQLAAGLFLGFFSGCFYPFSFFPEWARRIAAFLPSTIGFSYVRELYLGSADAHGLLLMLAFAVIFLAAAAFSRRIRTVRSK